MNKYLYCCGRNQLCKVYDLPVNFGAWKRLYFLDECVQCKRSVAVLQYCSTRGEVKTLKRAVGKKAVELRDKLSLKVLIFKGNLSKGTVADERRFYNNFGVIYNFNNRRIGTNAEFMKR